MRWGKGQSATMRDPMANEETFLLGHLTMTNNRSLYTVTGRVRCDIRQPVWRTLSIVYEPIMLCPSLDYGEGQWTREP